MREKDKIVNGIFIIMFIAIMTLPLLFFNHEDGKFSAIENKTLSSKPELYLTDGKLNAFYVTQFESYFNDNIGFKEDALAINILLKYRLFGVLDIPNWLLGEDDNFFYTTGGEDILTYTGQNAFSEESICNMATNLGYMNEYFEQQGCTTYNMFIPNKEAIYDELYDPNVYNAGEGHLDSLTEYMLENTDMTVVNIKAALMNQKDTQLYYKSYDASHWNMNGAFVGYQELMKEIKKDHPDIKVLNKDDFEIVETTFSGLMQYYTDIKILDDNFSFRDIVYEYNLKGGYSSAIDEAPLNGKEIDPNLNFYHYENEVVNNSETLFIVGDSYMYCFILPMLAESFEDVYFVRNTNAEVLVELAQEIKPTIFVFEVAERVVYEPYFEQMGGFKNFLEFKINIEEYEEINVKTPFHIDIPILKDGKLSLEDESTLEILGWAFDEKNNTKPHMIVAEVDGEFFNAEFCYRDDLAQMNEKYSECGFKFYIANEVLQNADNIKFYIITENGQIYQEFEVDLLR